MNIGGWGGGGKAQNIGGHGGGGGQTFRWMYTDGSSRPQSVPVNDISHIEN